MTLRALLRAGFFALLLCHGACASTPSDDGGGAGQTPIGDQKAHGTFQLSVVAPSAETSGFTSMLGRPYEGPYPQAIIWEEQTKAGVCRLLAPRVPFCDPPCAAGAQVCVEDDVCQPYPKLLAVGNVEVAGMAKPFAMKPVLGTYQIVGVKLPYPAFAEGDALTFTASGDVSAAAFTMHGKGIAPLVVSKGEHVLDGSPVKLGWEAAKDPSLTTISAVFDVSYHGGTKGKVQCEAPDTGSLTVPGDMLKALIELGTSGFPKVEITRVAKGTTDPPFPVQLVVQAKITKFLSIPGVISCMGPSDCPEKMTCGHDFKCI